MFDTTRSRVAALRVGRRGPVDHVSSITFWSFKTAIKDYSLKIEFTVIYLLPGQILDRTRQNWLSFWVGSEYRSGWTPLPPNIEVATYSAMLLNGVGELSLRLVFTHYCRPDGFYTQTRLVYTFA